MNSNRELKCTNNRTLKNGSSLYIQRLNTKIPDIVNNSIMILYFSSIFHFYNSIKRGNLNIFTSWQANCPRFQPTNAILTDAVNLSPPAAGRVCGRNARSRWIEERILLIFLYLRQWENTHPEARRCPSPQRKPPPKIKHPAQQCSYGKRLLNIAAAGGNPVTESLSIDIVSRLNHHNGDRFSSCGHLSIRGRRVPRFLPTYSRVIAAGRVPRLCVSKQDIARSRILGSRAHLIIVKIHARGICTVSWRT